MEPTSLLGVLAGAVTAICTSLIALVGLAVWVVKRVFANADRDREMFSTAHTDNLKAIKTTTVAVRRLTRVLKRVSVREARTTRESILEALGEVCAARQNGHLTQHHIVDQQGRERKEPAGVLPAGNATP